MLVDGISNYLIKHWFVPNRKCTAGCSWRAKFCGACGRPLQVTTTSVPKRVGEVSLQLLKSVPTLGETISKVLLPILLLFILGTALVPELARLWQSSGKVITIVSFTDTSEDESRGLGRKIADVLDSEIFRIDQLHALKAPDVVESPSEILAIDPEIPPLKTDSLQLLERIEGKIGFAGVEFPVRDVILALRSFLPRWQSPFVITGRLESVSKKVPGEPSDGPSGGSWRRGLWSHWCGVNTHNPSISGGSGPTNRRSVPRSNARGAPGSSWCPWAA
jgi:hypothetical protein